jgi:hypothetical protein
MTSYRCPACGVLTTLSGPCPGCGRAPDPLAAELPALDTRLAAIAARVEDARQSYGAAMAQWQSTSAERQELVRSILARVAAERAVAPGGAAAGPAGFAEPGGSTATGGMRADTPWPGAHRRGAPDASPRTVQNLLFILGGVLLGIGAIVFTLVAWARYGALGRETILAVATALAFAVPAVAGRRGLRATAETVAAVALLLLVLDGYGVWRMNVLGVRDSLSGTTYAGAVAAVVAGLAAPYGLALRLIGPRIAALIAAQPVVPLVLTAHRPSVPGWTAVFAAVAAANMIVAMWWHPARLFPASPPAVEAARAGWCRPARRCHR